MEPIRFGNFEFDREARELRGLGRRVRLQEQQFLVLSMLLERAGGVVTREQLRQALWPGSVYVDFDHGLNNTIARLREILGDSAAAPKYIETLPKVGYRFACPLEAPVVAEAPVPAAEPAPTTTGAASPDPTTTAQIAAVARRIPPAGLVAAVGAGVLLLVGGWLLGRYQPDTSAKAPGSTPSIAVLPFESLSDNPEERAFAAGLSEEMMNMLSRVTGLRVAGSLSSFQVGSGSESVAEKASILHVDHLLRGTVRRSGDRIRISAQLLDTPSGEQRWSEIYDRSVGEIFAIQDEIARAVTAALQVRLVPDDESRMRMRGTSNAEAYRLFLMGTAKLRGRGVRRDGEGAVSLYEQAIALDPGFSSAYAGISSWYFRQSVSNLVTPEESYPLGWQAAKKAMELNPDDSEAMRAMADFEIGRYRWHGDGAAYTRSVTLFRKALELDPANAQVYFDYGRAMQWFEPRLALEYLEKSVEMDPIPRLRMGLVIDSMQRVGMFDAARERWAEYVASVGPQPLGTAQMEAYAGNLDRAALALQSISEPGLFVDIMSWGIGASLGDELWMRELRRRPEDSLSGVLLKAAELARNGNAAAAFELLDRKRGQYPESRLLDLPAARFALVSGKYDRARQLLEDRLPDLSHDRDTVSNMTVLPALDLVLAWQRTGNEGAARKLLDEVAILLDGPNRPRLPMFEVIRARAHALAGDYDRAMDSLVLARNQGFAQFCALDLYPQPNVYVDCMDTDPAFAALRGDKRYIAWMKELRTANQAALVRVRAASSNKSKG